MMLQYQTRKGLKALLCIKRNRPQLWTLHNTFYTNITITCHSLQVTTAASLCWILPSQAVLPFSFFFSPSSNEFMAGTVKHTREPARRRHRWALHDASLIATDVTSHINKMYLGERGQKLRLRGRIELQTLSWRFEMCYCGVHACSFLHFYQWIVVILIGECFELIFKVISILVFVNAVCLFQSQLPVSSGWKCFVFSLTALQKVIGLFIESIPYWLVVHNSTCKVNYGRMPPFHMCLYIWLHSSRAARWRRPNMNKYKGSEKKN